jgi:Arc/MetJ family transcription regulator
MRMRTTLNIDDQILEKASKLTGISEKTALVRLGLESLIAKESAWVQHSRRPVWHRTGQGVMPNRYGDFLHE